MFLKSKTNSRKNQHNQKIAKYSKRFKNSIADTIKVRDRSFSQKESQKSISFMHLPSVKKGEVFTEAYFNPKESTFYIISGMITKANQSSDFTHIFLSNKPLMQNPNI